MFRWYRKTNKYNIYGILYKYKLTRNDKNFLCSFEIIPKLHRLYSFLNCNQACTVKNMGGGTKIIDV